MSDNRKDVWSGIFFIVLAVAYFCGTFSIRDYNAFGVTVLSSASVPRTLAVALIVLSLINIVTNLSKSKINKMSLTNEEKKEDTIKNKGVDIAKRLAEVEAIESQGKVSNADIILTVVFLILYTLGLAYLGFIIATFIYIIMQSLLMTQKAKRKKTAVFSVILSLVSTGVIYFLFNNLLELMLPVGIFGF